MNRKTAFFLVAAFASQSASADFLATTIENIGKPYEVIKGVCIAEEGTVFSIGIEKVMTKAFKEIEVVAEKAGANALVGSRVSFANGTDKGPATVVVCGTLVKTK